MKTFILINGSYSATFHAENMKDAKNKAINSCDCSKEIIVREINCLADFAKLSYK